MARVKDAYPKFAGNQADWQLAERHCLRQLEEGATWEQLEDAARRFAAFVNSGGRSEPKYVDLPSKFFGNGLWAQTWGPVATKAEARLAKNLDAGAEAKRQLFGDNHVGK
jgi:dsRNA-specific ribonuclease